MFKVEIKTDNAAFEDFLKFGEISRLLAGIAQRVYDGEQEGYVRDINGNTVGSFILTND